jgi:hypothetical protein
LALRISLLAAALLAALVWILRLLARRLIRVLAGLSGLIALSILLTILVGIILFVITFPSWSGTYDNRAYGGSFRQIKKKAVRRSAQNNCTKRGTSLRSKAERNVQRNGPSAGCALRPSGLSLPLLETVGRLRHPSLSDHISPTGAVRF